MSTFTATLEKASDALDRGEDEVALGAMLAAWRERRTELLAELIGRLSALYEPWFELPGNTRNDLQKAWFAKADRGLQLDLPLLLRYVAHGTQDQAVEQLERLSTWPADPRTTAMVVRVLKTPPYATSSGTRQFWRRLFRLVEVHGDPEAVRALDRARVNRTFSENVRGQEMRTRAATVVELLEAQFPRPILADAETAAIGRLATRLDTATRAGTELVAELRAKPGDAHVRSVLADWLMLRSPARTESIAGRLVAKPEPTRRRAK